MEEPGWLRRYADPAVADRVGMLDLHGLEAEARAAIEDFESARPSGTSTSVQDVMCGKNWSALGAFDASSRSTALDLLGFQSQLVFSTYSHLELISLDGSSPQDPGLVYGMVDAHNIGVAEFCSRDRRLVAAGFVATHDPERATAAAQRAIAQGCSGIEIPSLPQSTISITHPAFDSLYGLLEERGLPLLLHVGGGGKLVHPNYAHNGRTAERLYTDRESPIPALTYVGIPAPVEMTLAALILDGVFERFPHLQCGVIEQGATWVPGFLRRLDTAARQFGRPGQVASLSLRPSDYFVRQVKVTPFPFEDIEWLIEQTGADVYMFGSNYPHDEGGERPLEQFEVALDRFSSSVKDAIYFRNFETLMGNGLPPVLRNQAADGTAPPDEPGASSQDVRLRTGESLSVHRKKMLLRLLTRDVAGRAGLEATEHEMRAVVDSFRLECGLADLNDALDWMHTQGISDEALGRFACDAVLANKLCERLREAIESELEDHLRIATGPHRQAGLQDTPSRRG